MATADKIPNNAQIKAVYDDLNEKKANTDGSYANMTVGNAEQLVATVGVEDSTPYNFRTAGGTADIGDRLVEKVVGGTVAWNQISSDGLLSLGSAAQGQIITTNDVTFTKNSDGSVSLDGTQTERAYVYDNSIAARNSSVNAGDVMLLVASGTSNVPLSISASFYNTTWVAGISFILGQRAGIISKVPSTANIITCAAIDSTSSNDGQTISARVYTNCFNLTQMFGSAIADYIYSLEQATAGAGVAWFRHLFPKNYYAYNAGELMSVQAASHKTVGFNQWDEEWELGDIDSSTGENVVGSSTIRSKGYINVIGGATYYAKIADIDASTNLRTRFYDANKNYIGYRQKNGSMVYCNMSFVVPDNACYLRFATPTTYPTSYNHDICINLSWDGERDGEYEEYTEHVYPLDDSLTLRGIPKLDSNNNLYYDGDVYESDGTVTRKYGVVDLGTLTWTKTTTYGSEHYRFWAILDGLAAQSSQTISNIICEKYATITATSQYMNTGFGVASQASGNNMLVMINDESYADAAAFKTAMSGVMLVYELATPTTEEAESYQNPQIVDDFGTEEYVDAGATAATPTRDVAIPVGHESVYQANLRAKLEMSPDSPDGDGDYIVRQTNGQNEYVQLVIPTELPQNPSENGTYVLKATVNNGTTTLSWEAQS